MKVDRARWTLVAKYRSDTACSDEMRDVRTVILMYVMGSMGIKNARSVQPTASLDDRDRIWTFTDPGVFQIGPAEALHPAQTLRAQTLPLGSPFSLPLRPRLSVRTITDLLLGDEPRAFRQPISTSSGCAPIAITTRCARRRWLSSLLFALLTVETASRVHRLKQQVIHLNPHGCHARSTVSSAVIKMARSGPVHESGSPVPDHLCPAG